MGESGNRRKSTGKAAGRSASPVAPQRESALAVAAGPSLGWQEAIAATVAGLDFDLVDVERAPRGLLRVTIDRIPGHTYLSVDGTPDTGEFVIVDDCEKVTRQLQYALEVEGLEYARLEVSSPGLDRPLKCAADYLRFAGLAVQLTLKQPFEGRKSWQGVLVASEGGSWNLICKYGKTEQVLGFTLAEVREARLVPVLDFKGRKSKDKTADDGRERAADAAPAVD